MHKNQFTITELIIVLAVLTILISLLQPSLSQVIDQASAIKCRNKMKSIVTGFFLFAEDENGHLPGAGLDVWNTDSQKRSWIGSETGHRKNRPDQKMRFGWNQGTVWPYLGEGLAGDFYRCPALEEGSWSSGKGSNGLFDYVAFNAFSGAKIDLLPNKAYFANAPSDDNYFPSLSEMEMTQLPLIAEEDPMYWLNNFNIEGGHAGGDRISTIHSNGANFASVDGSVNWVQFIFRGPKAFEWQAISPKGNLVRLWNGRWGEWNNR